MKKILVACLITSIIASSLAGCGKSDAEKKQEADAKAYQQMMLDQQKQKQLDDEAAAAAQAQQAQDEKELADVVAELKKGDPLVRDAYYGYNEKGDRVLHVIRDNPPQPQNQMQQGYAQPYQNGQGQQPVIINNQPAQTASGGTSESIWPLVAGIGGGMLLANAINSSGGYDRYRETHQPYSSRNWANDNDYRRERTTIVNNYNTTTITNTKTAYKNPTGPVAQKMASQGFQPVKPAPSSASFAQSKQVSSPIVSKPTVQPAAKPMANPQVNSYWSQPKPEPVKQAAPTNSFWGSTQKASPAKASTGYSSNTGSSFKAASPSRTYSPSPSRSSGRR